DAELVRNGGGCPHLTPTLSAPRGGEGDVMRLTDLTRFADAQRAFSSAALWALFDGSRERLNIAHECLDRHAHDPQRIALRIARDDNSSEILTFRELADWSGRF